MENKNFVSDFRIIINIQEMLLNIAEEGVGSVFSFINEQKTTFTDKKDFCQKILISINSIANCHPKLIINLIDILKLFLDDIIECHFTSNSISRMITNKALLLFCVKNNIVSIDTIIRMSTNDFSIFQYFYKEIKENNYEYYTNEISKHQRTHENITMFESYLSKYYDESRTSGLDCRELSKIIQNDSFDEFQKLLSQTNISLTTRISPTIFDCYVFEYIRSLIDDCYDYSPQIIEYAAFFGAETIFKFLFFHINELPFNTLPLYAAAGGCCEIIHMIETTNLIFEQDSINCGIICHNNNLVEYLVDKNSDDNQESDSYHNVLSLYAKEAVRCSIIGYNLQMFLTQMANYNCTLINEALFISARYGILDLTQYIVECLKADVNFIRKNRYSALHLAANYGQFEIVKYLCSLPQIDIASLFSINILSFL